MQEETMDRRDRSHPHRFTTASDDMRIVRTAVMDRAATSRTIAQQIPSVTHHSASARIIRRRLQHVASRQLFLLSLTANYRRLHRQ
ncbi:hypothetical protein TNCV_4607691 [Trichonephila clavipes]|nr:hypothetical protein TNCV_4607691 [Trichonephila clavipes]